MDTKAISAIIKAEFVTKLRRAIDRGEHREDFIGPTFFSREQLGQLAWLSLALDAGIPVEDLFTLTIPSHERHSARNIGETPAMPKSGDAC